MMRVLKGWLVAVAFVLLGARKRGLRKYEEQGSILSVFGHESNPQVLEQILRYLTRKGFHFVSTDELLTIQAEQKKWRPYLAWLTYDDGWRGIGNILPILEKYNVPVTIFLSPEETSRGRPWSADSRLITGIMKGRSALDITSSERYAKIDREWRDVPRSRLLADWDELRQVSGHCLVTFENHTNSHLSCSHRPIEEVMAEVEDAKRKLNDKGLSKSRLVCYPFGHFTDDVDVALKGRGYVTVKSDPGVMTVSDIGRYRNIFHQHVSLQENISRILCAWPKRKLKHF